MSEYIKNRIEEGEHQQQDFKFAISDARKIARSLSAFANTDGGRLLVGVKDNGVIAGVRSDEEYYMIEAAASLHCKPEVTFSYEVWEVDGKSVLEVSIPKNSGELVKATDKSGEYKVYLRRDDENILANGIFVLADKLKKQANQVTLSYSEAEENLLHFLSENPDITFSDYRKHSGLDYHTTRDVFVKLLAWNVIKMDFDGKEYYYFLSDDYDMLHED